MNTTITSGQLAVQLKTLEEKGMTPERWNKILSSGIFADLCDANVDLSRREAVRFALGLNTCYVSETFKLEFDLARVRKMAVRHSPDYSSQIDAARATLPNGDRFKGYLACLFTFGQRVEIYEVLSEIAHTKVDGKTNKWRPARVEHLLAYSLQCPEGEWPGIVVAPGQFCVGNDYHMLVFHGDKSVRGFNTTEVGSGKFSGGSHFLAIRDIEEN